MLPKYEAHLEEKIQKNFFAKLTDIQPDEWPHLNDQNNKKIIQISYL